MKYLITESKLDKVIFKYLDNQDFIQIDASESVYFLNSEGDEYGQIRFDKNTGWCYIYWRLIEEISTFFGINESDSGEVIGRWVEDTLQMKVTNTAEEISTFFGINESDSGEVIGRWVEDTLQIKDDINESASIKLRRRINLEQFDKEFERALRACSAVLERKKQFLKAMTAEKFVSMVVSYMVTDICETQECNEIFDELWDYLTDRYNEQIAKKYFEVRHGRIIESSQEKGGRKANLVKKMIYDILPSSKERWVS